MKVFVVEKVRGEYQVSKGTVVGKYLDLNNTWREGYTYQVEQENWSSSIEEFDEADVHVTKRAANDRMAYLVANAEQAKAEHAAKELANALALLEKHFKNKGETPVDWDALSLSVERVKELKDKYEAEQEEVL